MLQIKLDDVEKIKSINEHTHDSEASKIEGIVAVSNIKQRKQYYNYNIFMG